VVGLDWLTLILAAGVFLAVECLLIASVVRLWRAAGTEAPRRGRPPVRWGWELLWTALPALGLLALALLGAQNLFGSPPSSPGSSTPTPVVVLETTVPPAGQR
jgi:heme/copper-type cytochrome/quinol oxidase subunit 2